MAETKNEQDYAVVVGIGEYKSLAKLDGPVNDAIKFVKWLKEPTGGNVPEGNIKPILINAEKPERPIQNDIDDEIIKIIEKAGTTRIRRLYFFFAGHGLGIKWNENGLCLPIWSELLRNAALSSAEYLGTIVESGRFEQVFFFLDCCRNRKISSRPLQPLFAWPRIGAGTGDCESFVAYAAPFDNPAFEAENWVEDDLQVRGLFTDALIMGLEKGARDQNGMITINSLKSFLKPKVEWLAKKRNLVQSVRYEDNFSSDGIIVATPVIINVPTTINFEVAGSVSLIGPSLNTIQKGKVKKGDSWNHTLLKGQYLLMNSTTDAEANFFIDGTLNPFVYAFKI